MASGLNGRSMVPLKHPVESMAVLGSAIAFGHKMTYKGSGHGSEQSYSFKKSSSEQKLIRWLRRRCGINVSCRNSTKQDFFIP